ncbi:MAG TPA: peptidylprolyl isomerase [Alphaproteobacteria bacterium]|nr:peptidylprolyl isomerase [Alphaproteobacteria bacterium]
MKILVSIAFALAWTALSVPVGAEEQTSEVDPVLAVVNGTEVRRSEVIESARALPPEYQAQIEQILPALVERYVDLKLLGDRAEASGLENDPEVKKTMADLQRDVVREVYLRRYLKEHVSEAALEARYQEFLKANPPQPEIHARHILVPTKEEADKAIEQINSGKEFAEVAAELSKGGSAQRGGDLGYFVKGDMVPEFSEAAFAIEPGQISKEPVQTQFGWHIIKVEDRRDRQPPNFEEVRSTLEGEAQQELVTALLKELREGAEIEIRTPPAAEAPAEGEETAPPAAGPEGGTADPATQAE